MYKHLWTKIFILAGLLMLPSAASMAAVVEMIIIPCTPQLRPDECGVKMSVTGGTATFTTTAGEVVTVSPGTAVTVSGAGIVSQSNQSGTILNFASAGSSGNQATGSTGEAVRPEQPVVAAVAAAKRLSSLVEGQVAVAVVAVAVATVAGAAVRQSVPAVVD